MSLTNGIFITAIIFAVAGFLANRDRREYIRNWESEERKRMLANEERRRRAV